MAKRKINDKIEFAYASYNIAKELKEELEKRYTYQKILVVDKQYEISSSLNELQNNTKCQFEIIRNIDDFCSWEEIACVIMINCRDAIKLKQLCKKNEVAYILVLTKIYDLSILCEKQIDNNLSTEFVNLPVGVVFDKSLVKNKEEFVCKFLFELSGVFFDITQTRIDNLFFGNEIDKSNQHKQDDLKIMLKQLYGKNAEEIFDSAVQYYIVLCLKKNKSEITLLDRIIALYKKLTGDEISFLQVKFLCQMAITSLEKHFFEHWCNKLSSTLNIERHCQVIDKYKLKCDFKPIAISQQKTDFLLDEFRPKLAKYVQEQIHFNNQIKSVSADLSVNFLYKTFTLKPNISDIICIEPILFKQQSVLSIMSDKGLLNYEF